ncbi:MAG TPA: sulfatase-like hydrolase/transferase, partial [Terracidiphilus sp.]
LAKQVVAAGSIFQSAYGRVVTRAELSSLAGLSDPLLLVSEQSWKLLKSGNHSIDAQTYVSEVRQLRGLPASAPANPNPPKRIVVIFVESFSLNFSRKYNPALPTTLTPNLDALSDVPFQPLHIRTISSPTTPGLGTHFCSVPNSDLADDAAYNCSVVDRLRDAGWHTVMFESPPENFDNGSRRFAQIGFSELYGAKYQSAHGNGNFVNQWGTLDRVTLASITSYIAAHRNEKLFIAGLTIDTHLPTGRTNYGSLTYPEAPAWIDADPARLILRSVFRFDHDISDFVEALRKIDGLEDTVIIITGDHSLPPFPELNNRLGLTHSQYEDIPFFIIGKKAPATFPSPTDSQLDTAPTLAYLAGVSPDSRWWGHSLFQPTGAILPLYRYDVDRGLQFNPQTGSFSTPVSPEILRLLESYPNSPATRKGK